MPEIENNNGPWETTSQQNNIQNISENNNTDIVSVLQSYLDNPTIVMWLVQDPRTPQKIIEQIALNKTNYQAQIIAIARIVNDDKNIYSKEIFNKLCRLLEKENPKEIVFPYATYGTKDYQNTIWYILACGKNTPPRIYEKLALHNNEYHTIDESVKKLANNPNYTNANEIYQSIFERLVKNSKKNNCCIYNLAENILWWKFVPLFMLEKTVDYIMKIAKPWIVSEWCMEVLLYNENENITKELMQKVSIHINQLNKIKIKELDDRIWNRWNWSSGGYTWRPYKA